MAIFNPIWYEKSQSVQIFDQQNQLIDLSTENLKEFKRNSWSPFDFSQPVLDSHDKGYWFLKKKKKRKKGRGFSKLEKLKPETKEAS